MTKQLTNTRRHGRCGSVPAQGFFFSANSWKRWSLRIGRRSGWAGVVQE